jgi:uncharacterized protein (DUF488 family)
MKTTYTVGHSNRSAEAFLALLRAYGIEKLIDVRTIPKSRHNPQFADESLKKSLGEADIAYERIEALGGFRKTRPDSPNTGWRNLSFRGYADYMGTPEFAAALKELEKEAKKRKTAIMCAEAVPWRCHRSLIADALASDGWEVFDILSEKNAPLHRTHPLLVVEKGRLSYPDRTAILPLWQGKERRKEK